jgi:hypothetical protein
LYHTDTANSGHIRRRTFIALHIRILSHVSYLSVIAVNGETGRMRSVTRHSLSLNQCQYVDLSTYSQCSTSLSTKASMHDCTVLGPHSRTIKLHLYNLKESLNNNSNKNQSLSETTKTALSLLLPLYRSCLFKSALEVVIDLLTPLPSADGTADVDPVLTCKLGLALTPP